MQRKQSFYCQNIKILMKKLLPIFLLSLLLFSCKKENENFETKIFIVAAQKTMCTPLYGTPHPCLQIKESPNDPFRGLMKI